MAANEYEVIIGLEVHCELKTKSKIFCPCPTKHGAEPNTQCCPVCAGLPGALPVLNRKAVELAVTAGLATNCTVFSMSVLNRKSYFYPDLPKAYQISQLDHPLCERGYIEIESGPLIRRISIRRIHIEEDAAKLIHDDGQGTLIDMNRCGVPLIEIVTEPDLRSADEAVAFLRKLRTTLIYTGVSDCRMDRGEFRCDVNLSVRKKGDRGPGVRTEIKNLNSFVFARKAIDHEAKRQIDLLESGNPVIQETRRFETSTGRTVSMRIKENSDDYRYFPDPDLVPVRISEEILRDLKAGLPRLPDERKAEYIRRYGLPPFEAETIASRAGISDLFEESSVLTSHVKKLANLITTGFIRHFDPDGDTLPVSAAQMASLADLIGSGRINSGTAKRVLKECIGTELMPEEIIKRLGLGQIADRDLLDRDEDLTS